MPTPQEARARQTAYEATDAWWRSRVETRVTAWRQYAVYYAGKGQAHTLAAAVFRACADDLHAFITERNLR